MLMGMIMGGFLAGRAAAKEPRPRILIVNSGVVDWGEVFFAKLREYNPELISLYHASPRILNATIGITGWLIPFLLWGLTDTKGKHGVNAPSQLLDSIKSFTNLEGAGRIKATTLVSDTEAEEFGQSDQFYDALTCEKDYILFTKAKAAPLHFQTGSLSLASQRIFDWIDEKIEGAGKGSKAGPNPSISMHRFNQ